MLRESAVSNTMIDGIDYCPLACLVGLWAGSKGRDVAPEGDGAENNAYYETILYEASGDVSNAESQTLAIVRYHQIVKRQSNNKVFHNETGYICWDSASGVVSQSFAIPRAVALVAGGTGELTENGAVIEVQATLNDPDWGISQSPFMRDNASTTAFSHIITVCDDEMIYSETTVVDIYDKIFNHTDDNTLFRAG
jgi:hypothetical protein